MARTRAAVAPPRGDPPHGPSPAEHPADRAVRLGDGAGLPAADRPGLDAVLRAFAAYEAGDDEAARQALQEVGLRSPFLDWKLLVRGLMAYAAGDDGRAVENWQRLAPGRLPARLAAPLRAAIDPGFKRAQPAAAGAALDRQFRALAADEVADGLRELRGELGRGKGLAGAFRALEELLPVVRRRAPALVPRLANCVYRAILAHGDPGDLARYRRLFGPPADDPGFHRLEALVHEDAKDLAEANRHWAAYEAWLATAPAGWPADVLRRARAQILHRMGRHAADLADDPRREFRALVSAVLGPGKSRKPGPPADPVPLWRRAAALAPDWDAPGRALFDRLTRAGKPAEAEQVAREVLAHNPHALPVLDALADELARAGRPAEALDLRYRALALNPLDRGARTRAADAALAAARRDLAAGRPARAAETLGRVPGLCEEHAPVGYLVMRAVIARKLGRPAEAAEFAARARAAPGGRLAAALALAVDGGLAKLPAADRRAADQALAAALAGPVAPVEADLLAAAHDRYRAEGVEYRGRKTHGTKVQAAALAAAAGAGPAAEFEALAGGAAARGEWKLVGKLAARLRARFPADPVFPLLLAEAEVAQAGGRPPPPRVARLLREAVRLAEASPDARHKDVADRARKVQARAGRAGALDELLFS